MRRFSIFIGVTTAIAVGGCVLLDQYEYSTEAGGDSKGGAGGSVSNATSTSSSGAAGAGLMGSGGATSGGGSTPCVPQVCNAADPSCPLMGFDCTAQAEDSVRYGMGGAVGQRVRAIVTRPGGGVVIGGEYDGTVEVSDGGPFVGVPVEDGGAPVGKPFVTGFDGSTANLFFTDIGSIGKQKLGSVLGLASDNANVYAIGSTAIAMGSPKLFVHKFNPSNGSLDEPTGATNKWDDYGTITLAADNFAAIGVEGGFAFVAANISDPGNVVLCDSGTDPAPGSSQGVLYKLSLVDGHCIQNSLLDTTIPTGITFFTNASGQRLVLVAGFKNQSVGPKSYTSGTLHAFKVADLFDSVTKWSRVYEPDQQTGILAITSVTSANTTVYVAGTFQGTWTYGSSNATIESINTTLGEFDTFVAAIDVSLAASVDVTWVRRFGGPGWQQPNSVVHKNGQLYLSGITHEHMAVDPTKPEGILCDDGITNELGCIYLLKITENGVSQWGRAFGFDNDLRNRSAFLAFDMTDLWLGGTWGGKVDFKQAGSFDTAVTPPNLVTAKFTSLP